VLQLPDVVSEVSHLLKRLLGETVVLVVKHGRNLGSIRADPGQLEQVIINLAVNARDAMASKGGGTLTIQTYAVGSDQVAELGSEILPIADYTALSVSDTAAAFRPASSARCSSPSSRPRKWARAPGLAFRPSTASSSSPAVSSSRIRRSTRERASSSILPVHRRTMPPAPRVTRAR
jgi:two-component system cell cycle sensor histidine kinase/response regulator CckA